MNSLLIWYSASKSTIHQGESLGAVLAKLDGFPVTALVANPCWVVELCQAGLFAATFVQSEIACYSILDFLYISQLMKSSEVCKTVKGIRVHPAET